MKSAWMLMGLSLLLVAGCKKTVEGEIKKWDRAVQSAKGQVALYPGFAGVLNGEIDAAAAACKATETIADEKARATAMAKARSLLGQGTLGMLQELRTSIDRLKHDKMRIGGSGGDIFEDRRGKEQFVADADKVLSEVEALLKAGAPDRTAATAVLQKAQSDLKVVHAVGRRLIDAIEAQERAKREAAKAGAAAKNTTGTAPAVPAPVTSSSGKAPAPAAAAQKVVTCKYCGRKNPVGTTRCPGCGAN